MRDRPGHGGPCPYVRHRNAVRLTGYRHAVIEIIESRQQLFPSISGSHENLLVARLIEQGMDLSRLRRYSNRLHRSYSSSRKNSLLPRFWPIATVLTAILAGFTS